MNYILCGMPKCGKTTIGKRLAEKLTFSFIDTDRLIENAYFQKCGFSHSCREIYLKEGETFFRELEKKQIASLSTTKKSVIATGGGALIDITNVEALKSMGHVIYLKTPLIIIWERIKESGIPATLDPKDPEGSFYSFAKQRAQQYAFAHTILETETMDKEAIVEAILKMRTTCGE